MKRTLETVLAELKEKATNERRSPFRMTRFWIGIRTRSASDFLRSTECTGKAYDMKIVAPQRSTLQPGPSRKQY